MRLLLILTCLGCARPPVPPGPAVVEADHGWPESESLELEGVLPSRVRGQAVGIDSAVVGFGPEVLRIDRATREIDSLIVTSGAMATVLDGQIGGGGEEFLVGTEVDLRVVLWSLGGFREPLQVPGVRGGAFVLDEPVVARADERGQCRVRFVDQEIEHPFETDCPERVEVAAQDRGVLLSLGQGGLWQATPGGLTRFAEVADGVSYDDFSEQIIAHAGFERRIFALDGSTGEELWEVQTEVLASVALPGRGLLWAERSGLGSTLVLADASGEELDRLVLDAPVTGLAASSDGSRVGITRQADYAIYSVHP